MSLKVACLMSILFFIPMVLTACFFLARFCWPGKTRSWPLIALLLSLGGCASLAPDFVRPQAPVTTAFPTFDQAVPAPEDLARAGDLSWNDFFTDPVLVRLIGLALDENRDLRLALLRVEEARAGFRIRGSELWPGIDLGGQGARSRLPADLSPLGRSMIGGEYRVDLGLTSWELDLWGRVRSLKDAAFETWLATRAASQAVRTILVAEVANLYLYLRELSLRIEITRQTVASRERSCRIFERRYAVGATSKLDLTQVQTLLTQAQVLLAQLELQQAARINALRQMAGDGAVALVQEHSMARTMALPRLAPGLPAEVLINRPDIMVAEHYLRAANANIGAARAAFLPRIALTSSVGTASVELDGLFAADSGAWTFVPTLSLPVFDYGRRRANLELSEIRRDLAVVEYERAIQSAFREVADALASFHWLRAQLGAQIRGRDAQAERARLAQLRYDHGSAAYLEVLDAQRDLLAAEQQVLGTERALLSSQVALYSALGGGANSSQPLQEARRP